MNELISHYRHACTNYNALLHLAKTHFDETGIELARDTLHKRIRAEWYFQNWHLKFQREIA